MITETPTLRELLSFVVDNRGRTCPVAETGLPLIATNCVKSNTLYPVFEKVRYVDNQTYENWFRAHPEPGDLIFVLKGSPGQVCMTPDPVNFCIAQDMVALRVDATKVYPPYLFAALRSDIVRDDIENLHVGSLIPHFKKGDFDRLTIPLPEKSVQEEIGDLYLRISEKIDNNSEASASLEAMARALYRSWFVDFDPVWAKLESRPPAHMPPATAALFPDSFGDDGLPLGWEIATLGDLLTLNYGKALKKDIRIPGPYPVYGSGGSDTTHVTALVEEPTIIVGRKGTVGSLRWAPYGCWPIDTAFYVTSQFPLPYILQVLQDLPLSEMNTDAAVPGLNRDNAYRLDLPFPGEAMIAAFDEIAGAWQRKIDCNTAENQTLSALRDSLLPKLMSGEIQVGDARAQVEEVA